MKPLMARKVKRGEVLREWESAEHHLSFDGLAAFAARQEARKLAAQADATEAKAKTLTLKRRA